MIRHVVVLLGIVSVKTDIETVLFSTTIINFDGHAVLYRHHNKQNKSNFMQIKLDYGRTGLVCNLPDANIVGVLGLSSAPPLANAASAVRAAFCTPIGTPPVFEMARGRKNAVIVICDITRPVPNAVILPVLLDELARGGLPSTAVTVLIATGTHRSNEGEELREMVGDPVLNSGCRFVNHVCTDAATNRFIGTSPNGVPVALNTYYLDADLKLTVGLIEPHFMAGYSGGRKMVMPGIAALNTVQNWHSPRFLEHPNATNGILDNNPVHVENTAIANMARPDLICDVTLDEQRRVTGVFAGDMERAWRAGVAFMDGQVRAPLAAPADIVVTSGGGYPLDLTYYQVIKGMIGALPVVKAGGTVIIAAEMAEGTGGAHFRETLLRTTDLQALVVEMARPGWEFLPDQWQVEELAKATRHANVTVVTNGVAPDILAQMFVTPAATVEDAVADARAVHGEQATIVVIPKGPYVLPTIV